MSDENNIAIKVDNLTKIYPLYDSPIHRLKESLHPLRKKYHHDFYALNDISFEVKKGETVGIIGKNGSGKSTLLKIITGVLSHTSGSVEVKGRVSALLELGLGFNPEFTGIENVYFQGSIMGFSRYDMDKKIDDILSFADIGEFVNQPVKSYSSGMYVRLAFAVAIMVEPEILIVDEALSVGDMNFQAKCMTAMTRIMENGATVLFVSHDVGSVKSFCSSAVYLEKGSIKALGNSGDVSDMYIKDMREEMNAEQKNFIRVSTEHKENPDIENNNNSEIKNDITFMQSEDFDKRVAQFRYGSGEAKITFVELVDEKNKPINEVDFNQKVSILIHIIALSDIDNINVGYHIRDSKLLSIIGCNFQLTGQKNIDMKKGEKKIIKFTSRFRLMEGQYSIYQNITKPGISNLTADFIDVIEVSQNFKMDKRPLAKLWTYVYLDNDLELING